jgi:hypothetical protein
MKKNIDKSVLKPLNSVNTFSLKLDINITLAFAENTWHKINIEPLMILMSAEISDFPIKVNRITTKGNKNRFKEFATVI